jgi:hypothetical protein
MIIERMYFLFQKVFNLLYLVPCMRGLKYKLIKHNHLFADITRTDYITIFVIICITVFCNKLKLQSSFNYITLCHSLQLQTLFSVLFCPMGYDKIILSELIYVVSLISSIAVVKAFLFFCHFILLLFIISLEFTK